MYIIVSVYILEVMLFFFKLVVKVHVNAEGIWFGVVSYAQFSALGL